jgi:hypothetical protein
MFCIVILRLVGARFRAGLSSNYVTNPPGLMNVVDRFSGENGSIPPPGAPDLGRS